jgi:tRNA-specific 2-thiouridylase
MNEGHTVEGAVLVMHEYTDTSSAESICNELGIPLNVIDCREMFHKFVIQNFLSEYKNGRTPNPCIVCNREVKFRVLYDYALLHGFDKIATGHYAKIGRIETTDGIRHMLIPPRDKKKDQTYMLSRLPEEILSRLEFPLADELKSDLRQKANALGLCVADKKDSQEICFIPDNDYKSYIERALGKFPCGNFIDDEGRILGQHKGIINYTVGQRKGLGISLGARVFVSHIDPVENTVTLSYDGRTTDTASISKVVFMGCSVPSPGESIRAQVKIRYQAIPQDADVMFLSDSRADIHFDSPIRSLAPGQTAVIYINDAVFASGFID